MDISLSQCLLLPMEPAFFKPSSGGGGGGGPLICVHERTQPPWSSIPSATMAEYPFSNSADDWSDDDEFLVPAPPPPPSPQEPSMLESVFSEQLVHSLICIGEFGSPSTNDNNSSSSSSTQQFDRHAHTLDKLLRRTQQREHQRVRKRPVAQRKVRSLSCKTANELAEAIAHVRISSSTFPSPSPTTTTRP